MKPSAIEALWWARAIIHDWTNAAECGPVQPGKLTVPGLFDSQAPRDVFEVLAEIDAILAEDARARQAALDVAASAARLQ